MGRNAMYQVWIPEEFTGEFEDWVYEHKGETDWQDWVE